MAHIAVVHTVVGAACSRWVQQEETVEGTLGAAFDAAFDAAVGPAVGAAAGTAVGAAVGTILHTIGVDDAAAPDAATDEQQSITAVDGVEAESAAAARSRLSRTRGFTLAKNEVCISVAHVCRWAWLQVPIHMFRKMYSQVEATNWFWKAAEVGGLVEAHAEMGMRCEEVPHCMQCPYPTARTLVLVP